MRVDDERVRKELRRSIPWRVALSVLAIGGLLVVSTIARAQAPATYYVDKDGTGGACNDANPGSEAQPWCTIQQAADTMVAGDIVYVRAATTDYQPGGIGVDPQNSGTFANRITYTVYPDDECDIAALKAVPPTASSCPVTIDAQFAPGRSCFDISESFITIDGIECKNTDNASGGAQGINAKWQLSTGSAIQYIVVQNSYIHDIRRSVGGTNVGGIRFDYCNHCDAINNVIHDAEHNGIQSYDGDNMFIYNNLVYNSITHTYFKRARENAEGSIVSHNEARDLYTQMGSNPRAWFLGNSIHAGNNSHPLVTFEHNLAHGDNSSFKCLVTEEAALQGHGLIFRNNTCHTARSIDIDNHDGVEVYDNIFWTTGDMRLWARAGIEIDYFDFNMWAPTTDQGDWCLGRYEVDEFCTNSFTTWQAQEAIDHSYLNYDNPDGNGSIQTAAAVAFVDSANGDYTLQSGSPACGAGRFGGHLGPDWLAGNCAGGFSDGAVAGDAPLTGKGVGPTDGAAAGDQVVAAVGTPIAAGDGALAGDQITTSIGLGRADGALGGDLAAVTKGVGPLEGVLAGDGLVTGRGAAFADGALAGDSVEVTLGNPAPSPPVMILK